MKKTNTKTSKSPAPATKPAARPAVKKKPAPPVAVAKPPAARRSGAKTAGPVSVLAPIVIPPPVPAVKAPAAAALATTIRARVDVGFGNALYIRGEGPGLSWEQGILMDCVAHDDWRFSLAESARPVVFKLLLNDLTWCVGSDYTVPAGGALTITPEF